MYKNTAITRFKDIFEGICDEEELDVQIENGVVRAWGSESTTRYLYQQIEYTKKAKIGFDESRQEHFVDLEDKFQFNDEDQKETNLPDDMADFLLKYATVNVELNTSGIVYRNCIAELCIGPNGEEYFMIKGGAKDFTLYPLDLLRLSVVGKRILASINGDDFWLSI